jgi:hypothetical protein
LQAELRGGPIAVLVLTGTEIGRTANFLVYAVLDGLIELPP